MKRWLAAWLAALAGALCFALSAAARAAPADDLGPRMQAIHVATSPYGAMVWRNVEAACHERSFPIRRPQ